MRRRNSLCQAEITGGPKPRMVLGFHVLAAQRPYEKCPAYLKSSVCRRVRASLVYPLEPGERPTQSNHQSCHLVHSIPFYLLTIYIPLLIFNHGQILCVWKEHQVCQSRTYPTASPLMETPRIADLLYLQFCFQLNRIAICSAKFAIPQGTAGSGR